MTKAGSAGSFAVDDRYRLDFLTRIVLKEASYLRETDGLLFANGALSPQALSGLTPNSALAERMDALNDAHQPVPMLMAAAHRWTQEWQSRSG